MQIDVKLCLTVVFGLIMTSCRGAEPSNELKSYRQDEVEIAPGQFLIFYRTDKSIDRRPSTIRGLVKSFKESVLDGEGAEWTKLVIPWRGTNIFWSSSDIPITLREHHQRLYLIGFDRRDNAKCVFRYYAERTGTLAEVSFTNFPKPIATQNMWFDGSARYGTDRNGNPVDLVIIHRNLDPANLTFRHSLTAHLWCHLLTGRQYYEVQGHVVDEEVLKNFIQEHKPIALPTIIKESPVQATTNSVSNATTNK